MELAPQKQNKKNWQYYLSTQINRIEVTVSNLKLSMFVHSANL